MLSEESDTGYLDGQRSAIIDYHISYQVSRSSGIWISEKPPLLLGIQTRLCTENLHNILTRVIPR